ncbi:hypothetical protein [Nonomuraea recticatena]
MTTNPPGARVRAGSSHRGRPHRPGSLSRPSPAAHPRSPFNLAKACALYAQGKTLQDIADLSGYSRSRVHVLLREAGVQMRDSRAPRASRVSADKRRRILAAWRRGKSNSQIIAECRTSSATIHKVVAKAGLEPRRSHRKYDHDRMRELRGQGWTLAAIADDQGTSAQYVWTIINGAHLKGYSRRRGAASEAGAT